VAFAVVPAGTWVLVAAVLCLVAFIQSKLLAKDETQNAYPMNKGFDFNNVIVVSLLFASKPTKPSSSSAGLQSIWFLSSKSYHVAVRLPGHDS
jgi:hypothetical protein